MSKDEEAVGETNKPEASSSSPGGVVIPFHGGEPVAQEDETQVTNLRILEALLFAAREPTSIATLRTRLPDGTDVEALLEELSRHYRGRGVQLLKVAGGYAFRTADDLSLLLQRDVEEQKKLSRAALETLAIIAYHQPVTRAEIEEIRGVSISKGTLDVLMETKWVRMRGRRRSPGRPVTYGTTPDFLDHFMLDQVADLPGLDELKGAGLLDSAMPANFQMPVPSDKDELQDDEDPLDDGDEHLGDLILDEEDA